MKIKLENRQQIEVDNVWVTSDLHLNHLNLCSATSEWGDISKCRQFSSLEEMNKTILDGINSNVKPNDCLIILGDVLFGEKDYVNFFKSLECKNIIYVFGNHCSMNKFMDVYNYSSSAYKIYSATNLTKISIDKQEVILCHYPIIHWENQDRGSYMLFGHLHGHQSKWVEEITFIYKTMDVGIDVAYKELGEYIPFEWKYIQEKLNKKSKDLGRH